MIRLIITKTPLRISLFGGGTDLESFWHAEEGCVLSTAIDKYIYVIVKERFDEMIYLGYSQKEIVSSVNEVWHDLIREAMRLTGVSRGVEIVTLADIPSSGSGLGSSSSLTVGLLNALYTYQGEIVPAETLARQACQIEIEVLGRPIGKQDQYIAAYGGLRSFRFLPDGTVDLEAVPCTAETRRDLRDHLLLFYTGVGRKAESILAEQNDRVPETRGLLRQMRDQAKTARNALARGDVRCLGSLMKEAWNLKRQLSSKISNPAIEEMVQRAYGAGALGAKITGAGGGGFLLVFAPPETHTAVRRALSELKEFDFQFAREGSKVMLDAR